jgi:hypothetical protein
MASADRVLASKPFEKLDSIPEGIHDVYAVESLEGFVRDRRKAGCQTTRRQFRKASYQERGMCLSGWTKVRIHAKVEPEVAAAEPRAASARKIGGLRLLSQAKHARVESSRRGLLARRHRKLDVIEIDDFTHNSILQSGRSDAVDRSAQPHRPNTNCRRLCEGSVHVAQNHELF